MPYLCAPGYSGDLTSTTGCVRQSLYSAPRWPECDTAPCLNKATCLQILGSFTSSTRSAL